MEGMNTAEILRAKRTRVLELARQHGARNVRVLGSCARGDAGPESDVDLLVDLEPGRTLFNLGALLMDLQDLLGRRVDLVTEGALQGSIRERVLKDAKPR